MVLKPHRKFRAFTNRHPVIAVSIAFTLLIAAVAYGIRSDADNRREDTAHQLYENSVAACGRGNVIRSVVYANTRAASQSTVDGRKYQGQLRYLRKQPFTNRKDGTVDCSAAITQT